MRVVLFGATGMVGQGVLRECLRDPGVQGVLAVVRRPTGQPHPKLREAVHADFADLAPLQDSLRGQDACFYCLGASSAGLGEADYTRVTHDYALAAGRALLAASPGATFVFVSGAGADSSERGRTMWARVKGRTENDLLALPFPGVYVFRPAFIQPRHGIVSRTPLYRALYAALGPLYPLLKALLPGYVTTTERVGRAMIAAARLGPGRRVLENRELDALAG